MYYLKVIDFPGGLESFNRDEERLNFGDNFLMRTMHHSRVQSLEASQTAWNDQDEYHVRFGNKFFATASVEEQQSFFHRIVTLPLTSIWLGGAAGSCAEEPAITIGTFSIWYGGAADSGAEKPAITIDTFALLDALGELSPHIMELKVKNVALSNQSDVEALSKIILTKRQTLHHVLLEDIECPIDYDNGPDGFFDPLLFAASSLEELYRFGLSARTHPTYSNLVSTNALRAFFSPGRRLHDLNLGALGLNDDHCHTIAEAWLASGTSVTWLHLSSNPAISAEGYGAFLGLINRTNAVKRFIVDDKAWQSKLNMVSEMNRTYGRHEYLTNGTFSSEERWWQWLQKLARLPDHGPFVGEREAIDLDPTVKKSWEEWEAKHLNLIWFELMEHPEFLRT